MSISNNISNTPLITGPELVSEKTQTESLKLEQNVTQNPETLEESATYKTTEDPQDTVTISKEAYTAFHSSAPADNGKSEASYDSSTTQTTTAGEASSVSQTDATANVSKLTVQEQQYDKDGDGELSIIEKQAMADELAKKAALQSNILSTSEAPHRTVNLII